VRKANKILSLLLCFVLIFQQSGLAQVAGQLDISGYLSGLRNSFIQDKFRPLHLRFLSYETQANKFNLLLDKGDLKNVKKQELQTTTKDLLNYFFIGVTLPNDTFWVNLRPDAENNIIDNELAQTDVGRILLEADLQLKKDTAKFTSPETPEGKAYWDKLYQKAGKIFGSSNITIPTLTRPWIVPDEIIIRETENNAYIYKATLKVMLEQDYLKDSSVYNFTDDRLKQLNEYSSQLIREEIIPKLTKEINTSKRYARLRQVYYSLILAQWFKARFYGKGGLYSWLINRRDLTGLESKVSWSKTTYFKAYQKSFKDGEYNIQQPVYTPYGQTIRSYFSGGFVCNVPMPTLPQPGVPSQKTDGSTTVTAMSGDTKHMPLSGQDKVVGLRADGGSVGNPEITNIQMVEEAPSPSRLPAEGLAMPGASSSTTVSQGQVDQFSYNPDMADEGKIAFELANNPNISPGRRAALLNKLNAIYSKENRGTSFSVDFVIAGDNLGGINREAHEDYHRQGELAEIIAKIAEEIRATRRSDGRFDLRSVVANSPGKRITTSHGEIYLTEDGILVIVDSRFQRDHAGRGELAVYARSRAKAQHELIELKGWIQFAVKEGLSTEQELLNGEADLGQILRNYMNGIGENLTPEQLASRRQEVFQQRDKLHQQGLEAERGAQHGQSTEQNKFAIIIFADKSTDWNGALNGLLKLREELERRGYKVRNTRVDSVESLIERVESYSAERAPDLLVIGAHGTQESMHLGNGFDGYLTLQNVNRLERIKSRLANGGTIVLQSCSTARGEGLDENMSNAFSKIFPQAEHIFAPRVPAGPRFVYNADNQVSGIKYDNHEGSGVVTSVNLRTGETNLTERGYDAVTGRKIARQITETLDQTDLDFIISSDEAESTTRNANGVVIRSSEQSIESIEKEVLIKAVLDQRQAFVNLGESRLTYMKYLLSGISRQLGEVLADTEEKRVLLRDLYNMVDSFISGKNRIQLFDIPIAFTNSGNSVLTVAYEEKNGASIALFNQLLNLDTNRGRQDRIIERFIFRHILTFVGRQRVEAIFGPQEDFVDKLFPRADYEQDILFALVDKYDPDKARMAFQGLLSANDLLSGQVIAGVYNQLKDEFLRKNSRYGNRIPIVAHTGAQVGVIELNRDGDIVRISLSSSLYPPSYAYDDSFIKNRQRILADLSRDPFVAFFLLNQLMFLQNSLSRIPVDVRQSTQFNFDVFQGANMFEGETQGAAHPEYGILVAMNSRREVFHASDDGTFAHEFHHTLANKKQDSKGSLTKNLHYHDPFNRLIRDVEAVINSESFSAAEEFFSYARTHRDNPVEAYLAAKAKEHSVDPSRLPIEIRLALEDTLFVARLTKRWIGDIVAEYTKKNHLQFLSTDREYVLNPNEWAAQRASYYLTLERQSLIEIYADAGIEDSFLSDQDINYFRQRYGEVSYWNYYRMRAKAGLSTPYSLDEIESQLKQLDQDSKNYALPTMNEVIGMVGNEQIRKNLENILGRIKQYKDTTFPEADFGIASSNDVGATRLEHEKFHEQQKFSEAIGEIANEIGAQKRSDGRWDLRGAVNKAGGKITTPHGELRIESDGILIIIDNRFNKDHAGRDEAAIYARNEIKVYHELSELRSWIDFARNENIIGQDTNIQEVNLGQKLRDWVNGRGVFSVNKAQLLERQKKVREAAELFHARALNDEKAHAQEIAVTIFRQKTIFGEIFFQVRDVELETVFANYDPVWDVFIISDDNMDKISDAARGDGQGRAFNFAGLIVLSQTDFKRLLDGDQDALFVIRHEKRHNDYRSLHGEAEKLSEEQKIIDEIYANYAAYVDVYGMEEANFADGKWANTIVSALLNDYLDKKMERNKREMFTVKITATVHLVNEYFKKGKGSLALEYLRGADSFDRVLAMSRDKANLDSNLAYYISFFSQHRDGWQTTRISTEGMESLIQEFENFRKDYSKNYGNENSGNRVTSYQNEEDFIIASDGSSREDGISYARKLLSGFRIKAPEKLPWLEGRKHPNFEAILNNPSADDILSEIPVGSTILSYGFSSVVLRMSDGNVLRIGRGDERRPNIKGLLQPVSAKTIGNYLLEILPFVNTTNFTNEEVRNLERILNTQGYTFNDYSLGQWDNDNLGRLPDGEVVVIDPGAVGKLSGHSQLLKELDVPTTDSGVGTVSHNPDVSTPQIPSDSKKGGIDFRALPIVNQQINMGMLKLSPADLNRLGKVNLDSEWGEIQNMVNAGIIPSNERIKEYVLASCLRQNLGNQMNKVLGCIADIMRMEEDRVVDADVELKDMLVLMEAGKPETELQCGLSQIKISPQEPQLIIP
jgi:hypothetical protein